MARRDSNVGAVLVSLLGLGLLVGAMTLPWLNDALGSEVPVRGLWPGDLSRTTVTSFVSSIGVPLVVLGGLSFIAVAARARGAAMSLAFAVLVLEIGWVIAEAIRRGAGGFRLAQFQVGFWMAVLAALVLMLGGFLVPHVRRTGR